MRQEPSINEVDAFVRTHPDGANLHEIAAEFGVSHQRINMVIAKALKKIYQQLSQRNIKHLNDIV